jgi:molybdopterin converting factor small subunit
MPSGYVIADVEVSDPDRYKGYTALSPGAEVAFFPPVTGG